MDPEAILINLRASVETAKRELDTEVDGTNWADLMSDYQDSLSALIEHVEAMDSWLSRGGFLPPDWAAKA